MSDILEEIQELSNKFSNLFEVEGLGDPAVDVPPSTNKIKRDRTWHQYILLFTYLLNIALFSLREVETKEVNLLRTSNDVLEILRF